MTNTRRQPTRVFPVPYQVDFSAESKGRHLDSTKRKLTWKFGFANPPSVFPHLFDAKENHVGDLNDGRGNGSIVPFSDEPKKGVECRGREHEIILTWSVLSGKAHIYVDSREIYRSEPAEEYLFNPFTASFNREFDLPNSQFNGKHRIGLRCYARTPMGAKNMVVDSNGGTFRQYDLTLDGLSYFVMPAVYELGTNRMWSKVSRWGLLRLEDPGHFDESKDRSSSDSYWHNEHFSNSEKRAMHPKTESGEKRMMKDAMKASLENWDKDHGHGKKNNGSSRPRSSAESDSSARNGRNSSSSWRPKKENNANALGAIGEDNLIDFGFAAPAEINLSQQATSDISVMDDDATTASFRMNTAWNSNSAPPQQQPTLSPSQPYAGQYTGTLYPNQYQQQQQQPQYQDPTFHPQYAQKPLTSVGIMSTNPVAPRGSVEIPSDASFAMPPPPTMDDYNNAFVGSQVNMGAPVIGGSTVMTTYQPSPGSVASYAVGMTSPIASMQQQQQQPQMAQYGMQQASQSLSQSFAPPRGESLAGGMPMSMGASPQMMANTYNFDPHSS